MRELINLAVAMAVAIAVGNIAFALTNHFLRNV
jgi:hypothetical protein